MSAIHLEHVSAGYDGTVVIKDLSLHIPPGRVLGLLGPSGCGKTTILRMIAGLLDPLEGDITFDGVSIVNVPTEKRHIGMVFQQHVLFPHMSVEENVAFGLRMQGQTLRAARPRVREVLSLVQLQGLEKRFPRQLSGGQQQRVALARAVITDPVVLLLDEPLSNLDARLRDDMRRLIQDVQRQLSITTVFVTHDREEAIELSDRMVVVFGGEKRQEGTPQEVYQHPVDSAVARFLGATNLIPATITADPAVVETPLGPLTLPEPSPKSPEMERAGMLSIRCEHITISPRGDGASSPSSLGDNQFSGRITDLVYRGGLISYRVTVGTQEIEVIDRSDRQFSKGETVLVTLPSARIWMMPE